MHKHFAVAVIFNIATFMIGITLTFNEVSVVYALSCKFDTNMYNGELFHIVTPAVCIELKICKTTVDALSTVFLNKQVMNIMLMLCLYCRFSFYNFVHLYPHSQL